jgi:hypothetical protein
MTGLRADLEFIYTPLFNASAKGLLDDDAMQRIEISLLLNPRQGDVIRGTGGVRKLRTALPARGKRGGARVIYMYVAPRGRVYFLLAYAKSRQADLMPAEQRALRAMAQQLERE